MALVLTAGAQLVAWGNSHGISWDELDVAFAQNSGFVFMPLTRMRRGLPGFEVAFAKEGKRRYAHWRPAQCGSAFEFQRWMLMMDVRNPTNNGIIRLSVCQLGYHPSSSIINIHVSFHNNGIILMPTRIPGSCHLTCRSARSTAKTSTVSAGPVNLGSPKPKSPKTQESQSPKPKNPKTQESQSPKPKNPKTQESQEDWM